MPPELLSQVFEEIRGNGSFREVVVGLNASKHVGHQGEGVARKEIAVPSKFNPPTTLITNHMPSDSCGKYVGLSISRWPSEPMSRIQQSLQQWVLFGEDLMKRCPQSTEVSLSIYIYFLYLLTFLLHCTRRCYLLTKIFYSI